MSVEGDNLNKLFEKPCDKRVVVLFLNGLPMVGLVPHPTSNPKGNVIHFTLQRNDEARAAWASILGSPLTNSGKVSVSVGFKDGFAVNSTQAHQFHNRAHMAVPRLGCLRRRDVHLVRVADALFKNHS